MTDNPMPVRPAGDDAAHYRVRAALLLLTPEGRIVLLPTPSPDGSTRLALPSGIVPAGMVPQTVATRRAVEGTSLIGLTAGRQLAVSLHPGGADEVGEVVIIHDHPVLSGAQVAALTADAGNRATAELIAPWELETRVPGEAREILAALAARIEDITAFLDYGQPTVPGQVDVARILAKPPISGVGAWRPGPAAEPHRVVGVGGWLMTADGRAVLVYDPVTGRPRLPGDPTGPANSTDPAQALTREVARLGIRVDPARSRLLGHHQGEARIATVVIHIGPQLEVPGTTGPVRILATPAQVRDLCPGQVADGELEALLIAVTELGVPAAPRRPVTLMPKSGLRPGAEVRALVADGPPGAAVVDRPVATHDRAG
ncbi:hypothetical protein [Kitasatospora aureofaciens]|uniref:hypothetical protein n=1 Tax=Kitasatospora aureofaciens TaxID=1894 RepID=UPI0005278F8E|nr:hypothetical protein [Kitasatospora aureofaciens]